MSAHSRIFIVEDEAIVAADLCQRLQRLGFIIAGTADRADRALEGIAQTAPDLVLMDIVIKGPINGIETARAVRAQRELPVVFLTSHADTRTVQNAVGVDPYGYVLKPFNDRELQVAIQIALQRHATEGRLRRLERWMATTLASIGDGVIATDRDGRVTLLNHAARRLTGWSDDEALGRQFDEVFQVMDAASRTPIRGLLERGLRETIALGVDAPVLLRRRDGSEHPVDDSLAPIQGEDGSPSGMVLVFRDASERVRAERLHRDKLAAEMAAVQKTRFLSRVSHELRTPLNAILGFTQLLELDAANPLDGEQRSRVAKVRMAGEHLLDLINDVLDLTRIEEGARPLQQVPVALQPLLAKGWTMVESQARARGIRLDCPPVDEALTVRADPRAVEQVLINMLSNGIKYNRSGSVLSITVRGGDARVEIDIRDQGQGLAPEQIAQLFQPFNRLGAENSSVEGSGLGLVITKTLVEAMGGTIEVRSEVGEGCCFTVALPRASSQEGPAVALGANASHGVAGLPPATLLYVEDEPLNALLLTEALRGVPQWRVVLAEDGLQGLEIARSLLPDLVLLDINLPGLTGDAIVQALRADPATRALRCIALSADALPEQEAAAMTAGFDGYWTKPLNLSTLVERLVPELQGSRARRRA